MIGRPPTYNKTISILRLEDAFTTKKRPVSYDSSSIFAPKKPNGSSSKNQRLFSSTHPNLVLVLLQRRLVLQVGFSGRQPSRFRVEVKAAVHPTVLVHQLLILTKPNRRKTKNMLYRTCCFCCCPATCNAPLLLLLLKRCCVRGAHAPISNASPPFHTPDRS